jgi:hypothetical protein
LARCSRCSSVLKNTSISRMRNHRKKCGLVSSTPANNGGPSRDIQKLIQSKIELDESEHDELPPVATTNTILWTEHENVEGTYIDESVHVEKVNHTAMEIINGDIQRHRKSTSSKKKRRSSTDSSSIDTSLSSFLIGCNLTFDVVDSPHFKKFMNKVNPNYNVPSSNQLKSSIISQLETSQRQMKKRRNYESFTESDSE